MKSPDEFFKTLYSDFNERNIENVISAMSPEVKWANGMEGGYVQGHDGVRSYWTRQFRMMSAKVTPVSIEEIDGKINIQVHQIVHDTAGNLLADLMVKHLYTMRDNKVTLFEIEGHQ